MRLKWDWLIFAQLISIGAISTLIISSISTPLAINQLFFWLIGLLILYVVSKFDYHNWQDLALPSYIVSIIVLILLLIFGDPIRGSVRWIDLGIFRFQPSEMTKAAAILLMASIYNKQSAKDFRNLLKGLFFILPAAFLIFIQPDIGNTLAFFAIWIAAAYASGMKFKHFALLTVSTVLILTFSFQVLAPYQKERIESFASPVSDPLGIGYNIIQSKIAIGSGQLFGKGYGHGSQSQLQFLPESESDFIFASISEQLGFVGASLLIILFVWLTSKIISYSGKTDRFGQLVLVTFASYLFLQFIVNTGMNMGLLPVTGITFPLVSYGGSSLITNLFLFGIIFSIIRKAD